MALGALAAPCISLPWASPALPVPADVPAGTMVLLVEGFSACRAFLLAASSASSLLAPFVLTYSRCQRAWQSSERCL